MRELSRHDLQWCLRRTPRQVLKLLKDRNHDEASQQGEAMKKALMILMFATVCFAQTNKPKEEKKPPQVSSDTLIQFYKADAQQQRALLAEANAKLDKMAAMEAWAAAVQRLAGDCGQDFQPFQQQQGDAPVCIARPPVAPIAATEKK